MNVPCKICKTPTKCGDLDRYVTCTHCLIEMATYFVNRKAGLFYEVRPPVTGSKSIIKKSKKKA